MQLPIWVWKLMLALVAAIWGGSFVVIKDTLDVLGPAWLMALRFSATALIVGALFYRQLIQHLDKAHVRKGAVLGLAYAGAYLFQTYGLSETSPGKNAFLTAIYCVIVPFMNSALAKERPSISSIAAALFAIVGVGFVSLEGETSFALGRGELLSLACAVLFAVHIVCVPRFVSNSDVMTLTIVQLVTCALVMLGVALVCEPLPNSTVFTPRFFGSFAYLVLLASCFNMVMQNLGQSKVDPASAALIMSLESVFAVLASIVFYHEALSVPLALGFALIFCAVLISELEPCERAKLTKNVQT